MGVAQLNLAEHLPVMQRSLLVEEAIPRLQAALRAFGPHTANGLNAIEKLDRAGKLRKSILDELNTPTPHTLAPRPAAPSHCLRAAGVVRFHLTTTRPGCTGPCAPGCPRARVHQPTRVRPAVRRLRRHRRSPSPPREESIWNECVWDSSAREAWPTPSTTRAWPR